MYVHMCVCVCVLFILHGVLILYFRVSNHASSTKAVGIGERHEVLIQPYLGLDSVATCFFHVFLSKLPVISQPDVH